MISPDFRNVELLDGEKVLWTGRPISSTAPSSAVGQRVFGTFFMGMSLLWILVASEILFGGTAVGAGGFISLLGVPFLLIGLAMAFGPNLMAFRQLKNTSYVLTDRRAIVIAGGRTRSLKSYDLDRIVGTEKQSRADNSGSIVFDLGDGTDPIPYYNNSRYGSGMAIRPLGFMNIADVDTVHRLIEQTRLGSGS